MNSVLGGCDCLAEVDWTLEGRQIIRSSLRLRKMGCCALDIYPRWILLLVSIPEWNFKIELGDDREIRRGSDETVMSCFHAR